MRDALVIDLSGLSEVDDAVRIVFWIGFSERFLKQERIVVVLPPALAAAMGGVAARRLVFLGASDPRLVEMERGHRVAVRPGGGIEVSALNDAASAVRVEFDDHLVVPESHWHPCMDALRRIVLGRPAAWSTAMHYVFTVGEAPQSLREIFAGAMFVDVSGPLLWPVAGFLMLDRRAGVAVTWLGGSAGQLGYCLAGLSLARVIEFNGVIGPAAVVKGALHGFRGEMQRFVEALLESEAGRLSQVMRG